MKLPFLAAIAMLAGVAVPAAAQTVLTLSATGTATVQPDQISAVLIAQSTAPQPAAAQGAVNDAMAKALAAARAIAGVTATTDGYNVADTSPDRPGTQFTASQTLNLAMAAAGGAPPAAFTALLGRLQSENLLLNGLDGGLSGAGRAQAQAAAIADAIGNLQSQARQVAAALGDGVGAIKTLNVNVDQSGPVMPMRIMAMAKAEPAPQAAPGPVTVAASVSGDILLLAKP